MTTKTTTRIKKSDVPVITGEITSKTLDGQFTIYFSNDSRFIISVSDDTDLDKILYNVDADLYDCTGKEIIQMYSILVEELKKRV